MELLFNEKHQLIPKDEEKYFCFNFYSPLNSIQKNGIKYENEYVISKEKCDHIEEITITDVSMENDYDLLPDNIYLVYQTSSILFKKQAHNIDATTPQKTIVVYKQPAKLL